jgi:hypothetical protein
MQHRTDSAAVAGVAIQVVADYAMDARWPGTVLADFAAPARRVDLEARVRLGTPVVPPGAASGLPRPQTVVTHQGDLWHLTRRGGRFARVARLAPNLAHADVVWDPDAWAGEESRDPLAHGLAEWLVHHRLIASGGLLLSACGVAREQHGVVFAAAQDGVTDLLLRVMRRHAHARVLSERRVAVTLSDAGVKVHPWPWGAASSTTAAPLRAIHFVRRAPLVLGEPMVGGTAERAIAAHAIAPVGSSGHTEPNGMAKLAAATPVIRLGFSDDDRIVRYTFGVAGLRLRVGSPSSRAAS